MEGVGLADAVFRDAVSEREDFELRGFVVLDTHLPVIICTFVPVSKYKSTCKVSAPGNSGVCIRALS